MPNGSQSTAAERGEEHQGLVYKPLAMMSTDFGSVIAVGMFDRFWTRLRGDRAQPGASSAGERAWYTEALIAALQAGAYAGAKALMRRNWTHRRPGAGAETE